VVAMLWRQEGAGRYTGRMRRSSGDGTGTVLIASYAERQTAWYVNQGGMWKGRLFRNEGRG